MDTTRKDKLTEIEGLGPVTMSFLNSQGINTFHDIKNLSVKGLKSIMDSAGSNIRNLFNSNWIEQAKFADEGKWDELKEWQKDLKRGR